jgi:heme/copper-type cytochrome/quinol oxidase subunit 2
MDQMTMALGLIAGLVLLLLGLLVVFAILRTSKATQETAKAIIETNRLLKGILLELQKAQNIGVP